MARRRDSNPPGAFDTARKTLRDVQRNYTYCTVESHATTMDFLTWAFDPEIYDKLKWAATHVERPRSGGSIASVTVSLVDGRMVPFTINCGQLGIATPSDHAFRKDRGQLPDVIAAPAAQVLDIAARFDRVAAVLDTFNKNKWSLGAAAHYLPGVRALFPPQSPIHALAGGKFKEPDNVGPMLADLRFAQAVLTDAFLVPKQGQKANKPIDLHTVWCSFGIA